ncbi:hypothetical protein [Kaarinaea lacus]
MIFFNKHAYGQILFFVSLLALASCNKPMPNLDLTPEVNKLFSALQAKDFDTMLPMYSDRFYKSIPREHWRSRLQQFMNYMGPMESYRITHTQADTKFSGKFFVFLLDTRHEGKKKAKHVVTFILPVDDDEVKLIGHKITAKGFG